MANNYYHKDADLAVLLGKRIGFVGKEQDATGKAVHSHRVKLEEKILKH